MSERYTRVAKAVAESAEYTAANTLSESGQEGAMSTNTESRQSESTGSGVADAFIDVFDGVDEINRAKAERQKELRKRRHQLKIIADAALASILLVE
jgi:hypothetical protein